MRLHTHEVRIPAVGATLAGTLLFPHGADACPGLILISGSGANDRDETVCGHAPFRVIAEYVAARGYAVLRCDDRGVGASTGDAAQQDFAGAVDDAVALHHWLAEHPRVHAQRIVLLGHSEGGLVAAAAAPRCGAAAVVMLAGPAVPIEQLLHEQARALSVEAGATDAQLAHERRMNERVFALARADVAHDLALAELEAVIGAHLRSWPDAAPFDEATVLETAQIMAGMVGAPAYRSLLRQRPAALLGSVGLPMLALYGGKDTQVSGAANADAFRAITAGNPHAEVRLLPQHNHLFQQAGTGAIAEYESLPAGPDAVVLQLVAEWLDVIRLA